MEKSKSITIIFLLVVGLLTSAAPAKTVSVLLQEGLYAEEIEGDLDAAIKIYEQVISESKKVKRTAAQATYRIGMCFLKKGEKDKAAEYFQNIITDFPSQKAFARKAEKQLDKIKPRAERIVEQAVMTISTCAEGDPRVAKALESLKGLDENVVVNELVKFLNSETNTVRRSAIYILWKGDLKDISAAVPTLKKLCSHQENITRGMAAIALGASKTDSSFDVLCNITLKDPSGYARRCAAYALGLMGNAEAKPILEKALEDSDLLVRNNAKAALTMLGPAFMDSIDSAEFFPVDQLIKSGKVPAFKTQIYDNTGLDLETGVSVPFMDEWPALCDVAWDNDGGGALMIKPRTSVRFLALGAAEKWEDAISMARNSLGVLRTSTSKGMFASQSKFVAVLTSEGNLAVIQIGEYDAKKGTIYVWIEYIHIRGFGPVIERLIDSDETDGDIFFDLDTAQAYSFPPGLSRASPPRENIEWSRTKGIDFANDRGRLELVDMTAVKIKSSMWESATSVELRDALLKGTVQDFLPSHSKDYTISSPFTYAFETREGGIGLLQILEKKNENLRIRYKMLHGQVENPAIANALSVAEAFLAAVVSGRDSEAIKLVKPGSAVVRQVKDFRQILEPEKLKIVSVYTDERIAVVTTTGISVEDQKGPMLIRLIKQRGVWMVEDIDLETPASLKAELDSFLQKHPNATKLPEVQIRYKMLQKEKAKSPIDLSTPEATIKSFVKAVYDGNLEAAKACVSKDGADYDEFKEMLATESNHPFQAMIKAMDVSVPVEITSKSIKDGKCKISWYLTLGRVYYFGETKMKKGMHQEFSSYLELVGDKWLIRDI